MDLCNRQAPAESVPRKTRAAGRVGGLMRSRRAAACRLEQLLDARVVARVAEAVERQHTEQASEGNDGQRKHGDRVRRRSRYDEQE